MKDRMTSQRGKLTQNRKSRIDAKKKKEDDKPKKGKRKSDESTAESGAKRKKDGVKEVDEKAKVGCSGSLKRSHDEDSSTDGEYFKLHSSIRYVMRGCSSFREIPSNRVTII